MGCGHRPRRRRPNPGVTRFPTSAIGQFSRTMSLLWRTARGTGWKPEPGTARSGCATPPPAVDAPPFLPPPRCASDTSPYRLSAVSGWKMNQIAGAERPLAGYTMRGFGETSARGMGIRGVSREEPRTSTAEVCRYRRDTLAFTRRGGGNTPPGGGVNPPLRLARRGVCVFRGKAGAIPKLIRSAFRN